MNKPSSSPARVSLWRRLLLYLCIGLVLLYAAGVGAGYAWLHYVRKNDQIGLLDVAFFRVFAVRRGIAAQHFVRAQGAWDAKNYQEAYLYFSSGVRQDPDNIPGRLAAVRFLRGVGAGKLGQVMLEEGLARAPDDRRLVETTFDFLLSTNRDRHALDLLRERHGAVLAGPNASLLQRYEVAATLTAEGAPAAKQLLERYPGLAQDAQAVPVVARVLWESRERLRAIGLLRDYLALPAAAYADFARLAEWQEAGGLPADATKTAEQACRRFPQELAPRVLLIETLAPGSSGPGEWRTAIAGYLRDFAGRPEAIVRLAELAGQKGWVDLARTLYETGAVRQADLNLLALYYSDALGRAARYREAGRILAQIETQAPEANAALLVQLRQRQVIAAAALNDTENVREYARRLAAVLRGDADGLEVCRRVFRKLRITEAVAELSSRSLAAGNAAGS